MSGHNEMYEQHKKQWWDKRAVAAIYAIEDFKHLAPESIRIERVNFERKAQGGQQVKESYRCVVAIL